MIVISPAGSQISLGQILPAQPYLPRVPNYVCSPDRSISAAFSYTSKEGIILRLWMPSVIHDIILRENITKGLSVHDAYVASGVGAKKVPDMTMRPCIRSALLTKGYEFSIAKSTCDQYWHCFQEYINGFVKHPAPDPLDRRMELGPGVFTPSPKEEKCIRETFAKIRSLRDSYNHCGCADIYPPLTGAAEYISASITANPGKNLYWTIKEHYISYRTGQLRPEPTPTPAPTPEPTPAPEPTPGPEPEPTIIPVTPTEEEEKAGINWLPLLIGGVVVFALMSSGGEESQPGR